MAGYFGIPFAKQPIGERRFAPPQMVDKWAGEFDASKLANTCHYTLDSVFPQFPGAEMWNAHNVSATLSLLDIMIVVNRRGLPKFEYLGATAARRHHHGLGKRLIAKKK